MSFWTICLLGVFYISIAFGLAVFFLKHCYFDSKIKKITQEEIKKGIAEQLESVKNEVTKDVRNKVWNEASQQYNKKISSLQNTIQSKDDLLIDVKLRNYNLAKHYKLLSEKHDQIVAQNKSFKIETDQLRNVVNQRDHQIIRMKKNQLRLQAVKKHFSTHSTLTFDQLKELLRL